MKRIGLRIVRFVQAAGLAGGGSVSLAIALFGISIFEHFSDKNIPAYWLVLLAAAFFAFGAYIAWSREHDDYVREQERNEKPLLKIEANGMFFQIRKRPDTYDIHLDTHVYAYLKVTNLNNAECLIRDGTLKLVVDGVSYLGTGDDANVIGKVIEHVSDFRLGGEIRVNDAFQNTISPFPRLQSQANQNNPLRRGIPQEGFFVFTFPNLTHWEGDNPHVMPVGYAKLTLRDSFDGTHVFEHKKELNIPNGLLVPPPPPAGSLLIQSAPITVD